ncbi:MAG TPA: ABC transporter permease subunit [Terriglobales bacterium]|jgi:ABC-2 type transport system permease protein
MAVHPQIYRPYQGPLSGGWRRVAVVHHYARRRMFDSRVLTALFFICLLVPFVQLVMVYLSHNLSFLSQASGLKALTVDNAFFQDYLHYSCVVAFIFVAFAAPGLVAPDLAHGGLSIILARPLTRWQYIAGKFSVLAILLSLLTWVPAEIVFLVQYNLATPDWRAHYYWIAGSLLLASALWIVVLSLLALAVSAWVKWRIVAAGALLGIYFLGSGFAAAADAALQNNVGDLFSLMQLHLMAWSGFFDTPPTAPGLTPVAWLILLALAGGSLALLYRRIRGMQVVR